MQPLYEHQKKILKEDKLKCGLFLGTGASKTRTALELAEGSVLVICPKQQREDQTWQRENEKWGTNKPLTVISKEDLRKNWEKLPAYTTVIIDECHNNLGVLPMYVQRNKVQIPKTSQIFEATQRYLTKHPPKRLYLLSATPVPKAMSMWAIGVLFGQTWDFKDFRDVYYTEVRMGSMRRIWLPKKDEATKQRLADLIQKFGYTGGLNDFFDVPEQTHKTVEIDLSGEQKKAVAEMTFAEADPLVRRARLRTIENGVLYGKKIEETGAKTDKMTNQTKIFKSHKIDYILERALEFPKLLIFANYTAQIMEIEKALKEEGYNVSTLTGATKDRSFIRKVNESPDPHIIIAQSSISAGYELPSFPCVIYASKSWRYVDYEQSLGRVLRANHLKKNLYIHLVVKGCDLDCHKAIMSGVDFQEKLTLNI
jgi:SNF2 family DNA or RNA helicase